MKKKLSFLLALIFVLTLAFSVLPGVPAQAAVSDYTLDQKIDPITQKTYSYAGSNIIVVKQGNYAFIWKDGTITDNDTTLKNIVAGLDSSVNTSRCYVTTSTSFWLNSFGSLSGDAQFNFQVTINTSTKQVTIQKYEWQRVNGSWTNVAVAGYVSHIDLISYDPLIFGKLKVMKNVSGTGASTSQEFTINLVFTIGSKGSLSDIQFDSKSSGAAYAGSNGVYTLTLADDEYVSFKNIPVGTTYTVSETVSATGWTGPSNSTGSITDTTQKIVTVENLYTPVGSLEIKKDVQTNGAPSGVQFPIFVQFTGNTTGMVVPSGVTSLGSGKYSFSLADYSSGLNNSKVFSNIPYTVTYTVSEGVLLPGWNNDNENGELSGTINSTSKTITVENRYETPEVGSLKIVKALAAGSDQNQTSPSFKINVQFTKANTDLSALSYQTSAPGVTVANLSSTTNGLYQVTLEIGQWVNFTNVPKNATYVVSEVTPLPTNWSITQPGDIVCDDQTPPLNTIDSNGDDDMVTVNNTYKAPVVPTTGTLTVFKNVINYDEHDIYAIDVTFANASGLAGLTSPTTGIPGTANDLTLTYTVDLVAGGSALFTGIPLGTTYTVVETTLLSGDWDLPVGEVKTPVAIDANNLNPSVTVVNTYNPEETPEFGTLTVTKRIMGDMDEENGIGQGTFYTFKVTFTGAGASGIFRVSDVPESAPLLGVAQDSKTFTFTLHHEEIIEFANVPVGITYSVIETDKVGAISTTGEVPEDPGATFTGNTTVTIRNYYDTEEPTPTPTPTPVINYGSLTVTKTVTAGAATNDKFDITVTFTPGAPDFWNVLGISAPAGATGGNGVYTLRLSANDGPVTFTNIPVGTTYTIVEEPIKAELTAKGWTAGPITNATGPITAAGANAVVSNIFSAPAQVAGASDKPEAGVAGATDTLPQTGGISNSTLLALFGLALIAVGGTTLVLFKKKGSSKSK